MKKRYVLLFLLFSTNLIAAPSEDDLSDRSIEEIVQLGFDQPKFLQDITKKKLEMLPELETNSKKAIAIAVWPQVWDQVWSQVGAQVWDQVRDQVRAQARDQVWLQVWDQVRDQVRDQIWDQIWLQFEAQVRIQVWLQVWDQVGTQIEAQIEAQVGAQFEAQVRGILPSYPNLVSSEEEISKFIKSLTPLIDSVISVYHYMYIKKILGYSDNDTKTIFEIIVDEVDEVNIDLASIFNAATPDGWENMRESIKNFLYPIQKYSKPAED